MKLKSINIESLQQSSGIAAVCDVINIQSFKSLELFAGSQSFSKLAKELGFETFTSDIVEGLHMVMLFIVEQVTQVTMIFGKRR